MKQNLDKQPTRVGLISLGCAKNLVDAEIMLGTLLKSGVEITNDQSQADVMIVNTCSFIDSAQEESIDVILESAEVRAAKNRGQALVVSGCLPQRFREELPKLLPEVDAFMGIDQVAQVAEIVARAMVRRQSRSRKAEKGSVQTRRRRLAEHLAKPAQRAASAAAEKEPDLAAPQSRASDSGGRVASTGNFAMENAYSHAIKPPPSDGAATTPALVAVNPRPKYIPDYATPRFRLTPRHFAYLKIAEGCNHPCSFCTIPRMRGAHRSRPLPDIIAEAKRLIAEGVRELNLISQDSTYYGMDLRPGHVRAISSPGRFRAAVDSLPSDSTTICSLLRELNALPGDFWIRLLYTHPAHWTDELITTLAECPKVARYVDIPLQHIHDNMLERMRRETSRQYILELLQRIRARVPGIALRTTFIVGFPGETEACFQTLLEFIRTTKFERLGVFTYSREQQTIAGKMAGQISEEVKRRRREAAMREQQAVAAELSRSFVGRSIRVLVEKRAHAQQLQFTSVRSWEHGLIRHDNKNRGESAEHGLLNNPRKKRRSDAFPDLFVARSEADAPDIDGRVYVRGASLPTGQFIQVKVIDHSDYDLLAEPA